MVVVCVCHEESLVVLIIMGKMSRTVTVTGGEHTAGLDDVKRSALMSLEWSQCASSSADA